MHDVTAEVGKTSLHERNGSTPEAYSSNLVTQMKLVLLYDTGEADFARDVHEFLRALGLAVSTVVGAANRGDTLAGKERRVLDEAEGFIFLLTPGSERDGKKGYASQSVCDEMGRADERFKNDPSKVIYLADSEWQAHAINQKAYIRFTRTDHRSIVQALRSLVMELRGIGAFSSKPKQQPDPTIAEVAPMVSEDVKAVCKFVANQDKAMVQGVRLDWFIRVKLGKDQTRANLLLRELKKNRWLHTATSGAWYSLADIGLALVQHELERPAPEPSALDMARFIATYGPLLAPPTKREPDK